MSAGKGVLMVVLSVVMVTSIQCGGPRVLERENWHNQVYLTQSNAYWHVPDYEFMGSEGLQVSCGMVFAGIVCLWYGVNAPTAAWLFASTVTAAGAVSLIYHFLKYRAYVHQ